MAAALLNPPMPVDREDDDGRECVARILLVKSVPAPRTRVRAALATEGPAMNSISLLLVSGNLDDDVHFLLLDVLLIDSVTGREDIDR